MLGVGSDGDDEGLEATDAGHLSQLVTPPKAVNEGNNLFVGQSPNGKVAWYAGQQDHKTTDFSDHVLLLASRNKALSTAACISSDLPSNSDPTSSNAKRASI